MILIASDAFQHANRLCVPRKGSPILARTGDWSKAYFATGGVTAALRRQCAAASCAHSTNVPKQTQRFAPACHFLSPPVRRRSLNRLFEIHLWRKMACCLSMNGRFAPEAVDQRSAAWMRSKVKTVLKLWSSVRYGATWRDGGGTVMPTPFGGPTLQG